MAAKSIARLLHGETAHGIGAGGGVGSPVIEAGHRVLFCAEGKVRSHGLLRPAGRRHEDGIRMRSDVHHHAEVVGLAAGVGNGRGCAVSAAIARINISRRIEARKGGKVLTNAVQSCRAAE